MKIAFILMHYLYSDYGSESDTVNSNKVVEFFFLFLFLFL